MIFQGDVEPAQLVESALHPNDDNCHLYVSSDGTHSSTAWHNALGAQVVRLIAETVLAA